MGTWRKGLRLGVGGFLLWVLSGMPAIFSMLYGVSRTESGAGLLVWLAGMPVFFAGLWLVLRWAGLGRLADIGFALCPGWWRQLLGGFGLGALAVGLALVLGWANGEFTVTGIGPWETKLYWMLVIFIGAAWAALSEELVMRGYLVRALSPRLSLTAIALVNAVLFALIHIRTQGAAPLHLLFHAAGATMYLLPFLWTGSLHYGIGMHAAWNTFNVWFRESQVILLKTNAPGMLPFQVGLIATDLTIIAILAALLYRKQKSAPASEAA